MRDKGLMWAMACMVLAGTVMGPPVLAKKKITWWAPSDNSWRQVREKFMAANPTMDVQMIHGDVDKFYTMITAGLMPDIWGPWSTAGIHADVNRNWAIDLTPYLKRDGKSMNIDDFFPGVMRQFKIAGKQFSLPIFSYADYYFYNPQLYAQAGLNPPPIEASKEWNWDRMVANSQKLTVLDAATGKPKQFGLQFSTGLFDFPNYFHLWGAEPYSVDTLRSSIPQDMHWTTPEMVTCLTKMWELKFRYNVVGGSFTGGKLGSTIEHGYNIQSNMQAKKLKWAIAPLPWAVTNSGTLWPDGWRISRVCKDKELAWKFIKFICSPDIMRMVVSDPKSAHPGSPVVRKSIFKETLGRDVGNATGMAPQDVFRVHEQADDVGIVKYQETVCLHVDIQKFLNPELDKLWANKVDGRTCATNLQKVTDRMLPGLFARWLRNVKFTGADKSYK